ncbi:MAG: phasin family protein [Hyphomicrobium sp.]|nr:phasin family protein [Hyphomicrobium sp.]
MINSFEDFQKVSKLDMDGSMHAMGEWNKNWQAMATEMTNYSKRSFEDGMATFQKLATAKSVPEVIEIQTTYAKSAYDDYMQQMAKIGTMHQSFAKDAFKPAERTFKGSR